MYCVQPTGAGNDLDAIVTTLVTTRQSGPLPLRFRPLIGMLASSSQIASEAGEGQGQVMGADAASINAVLAAGGEVRLIPLRLPLREEDPIELVLQTVLPFDGLFFSGFDNSKNPCLAGQIDHSQTNDPDPVLNWWIMLMALVARQTLTPLFGTGLGGELINLAFGGAGQQLSAGRKPERSIADNQLLHTLEQDTEQLARCLRGNGLSITSDDFLFCQPTNEICCRHGIVPDQLASAFLAWGWSDGVVTGFGYPGPAPWFALATLFQAEVQAREEASLAHCLFRAFLEACRSYAGSLRDALRSTRTCDLLLRKLYRDPLTRRFLQGPLNFTENAFGTD